MSTDNRSQTHFSTGLSGGHTRLPDNGNVIRPEASKREDGVSPDGIPLLAGGPVAVPAGVSEYFISCISPWAVHESSNDVPEGSAVWHRVVVANPADKRCPEWICAEQPVELIQCCHPAFGVIENVRATGECTRPTRPVRAEAAVHFPGGICRHEKAEGEPAVGILVECVRDP